MLAGIRFPLPEKDKEWRTNPGKTTPYLTNQQFLRRVNPRVLAARSKKPEAIQAEKQAKSSKDRSVSDKLDILIRSVSNLKEDYKEFGNWLAMLETPVEKKGPESSDDTITQADEYSHDFENEIEDSEEDANQLDSESYNDSFDAGVIADNVGPAIDKGIVSQINEGLLLPSDRSRIKAIVQTQQRPENIESLHNPKLKTALQNSDVGAKRSSLWFIARAGRVHIEIMSNQMSEVKQGKWIDAKCMNSCLTPHASSLRHTRTFPSREGSH